MISNKQRGEEQLGDTVTLLSLEAVMSLHCLNCWPDKRTDEETCPDQTCCWYPFRIARANEESIGPKLKDKLTVFDFDAEWSKVKSVLDDPLALRALDAGMRAWCQQESAEWNASKGPWSYSRGDGWCCDAEGKFDESDRKEEFDQWCKAQGCPDFEDDPQGCDDWHNDTQEAWDKQDELMAEFYPQPGTPDWYRCLHACHWLAVWNCAIGELLFPNRLWYVVRAEKHSTAIGFDGTGMMCMDILWGQDYASDIWEAVCDGDWGFLMSEIECMEEQLRQATEDAVPIQPTSPSCKGDQVCTGESSAAESKLALAD